MNSLNPTTLWKRWVAANGMGEMLGLGLTFAVGMMIISRLENQQSVQLILFSFLVAVFSGVIEATLVSLVQWWAMHQWFPAITRGDWWLATLIGALVAYCMGYMPSTLMSLGEQASQTQSTAAEPAQWLVLLMAAGLGLVGGAILSFAQWLTMRKNVQGASIWSPANMLAWLVGMPIIFWGIDIAQRLPRLVWVVLFMACVLLLTGMIVGAIHGLFLIRLAKFTKISRKETGSIISPS